MQNTDNITHNVFVYGTLKSGFGNHPVMERSGGKLISRMAVTQDQFLFVDLGPFPAAVDLGVDHPDATHILGELYGGIKDLSYLDALEGYPSLYNRRKVTIRGYNHDDFSAQEAFIYYMEKEPQMRSLCSPLVALNRDSGDYEEVPDVSVWA